MLLNSKKDFNMQYKTKSLEKYIFDLSAKIPAPGGGSAAALCAAMAAALLNMTIHFTLGKAKYSRYEKELKKVLNKSDRIKNECLKLVDLDILAFKSGDARKSMAVPLSLARTSFDGLKLLSTLSRKVNRNLISDLAVSAEFFEAAFSAAFVNVRINLQLLNNAKLTSSIENELAKKLKAAVKIRAAVEKDVCKIIKSQK